MLNLQLTRFIIQHCKSFCLCLSAISAVFFLSMYVIVYQLTTYCDLSKSKQHGGKFPIFEYRIGRKKHLIKLLNILLISLSVKAHTSTWALLRSSASDGMTLKEIFQDPSLVSGTKANSLIVHSPQMMMKHILITCEPTGLSSLQVVSSLGRSSPRNQCVPTPIHLFICKEFVPKI